MGVLERWDARNQARAERDTARFDNDDDPLPSSPLEKAGFAAGGRCAASRSDANELRRHSAMGYSTRCGATAAAEVMTAVQQLAVVASDPKMVPTPVDIDAFLQAVPDENRRADAHTLLELMHSVTGEPPVMWGPSIVGFGSYHYRSASGRTGEAPLAAFSPRKANLVVYLVGGFEDRYAQLLEQLGPHKTGKALPLLRWLSDVDLDTLRQLVERSMYVGRGVDKASRS